MIGRFLRVCGKIQDFIFEPFSILRCAWKIDRRSRRKPGTFQDLLCPKAAEFDPGIFPWIFTVCKISIYAVRLDQESHPALKLIFCRVGILVIDQKRPFAWNNIMEQEMIPHKRPIGVQRAALFIPVLVECKIHKTVIWKHMKQDFIHILSSMKHRNWLILLKNIN